MSRLVCPYCGSKDVSLAEREYARDYPFWMVLAAVFLLMGVAFLLFFLLQLHPVILILILVAAISKLLDAGKERKRKSLEAEYICLKCDRRFTRSN